MSQFPAARFTLADGEMPDREIAARRFSACTASLRRTWRGRRSLAGYRMSPFWSLTYEGAVAVPTSADHTGWMRMWPTWSRCSMLRAASESRSQAIRWVVLWRWH